MIEMLRSMHTEMLPKSPEGWLYVHGNAQVYRAQKHPRPAFPWLGDVKSVGSAWWIESAELPPLIALERKALMQALARVPVGRFPLEQCKCGQVICQCSVSTRWDLGAAVNHPLDLALLCKECAPDEAHPDGSTTLHVGYGVSPGENRIDAQLLKALIWDDFVDSARVPETIAWIPRRGGVVFYFGEGQLVRMSKVL